MTPSAAPPEPEGDLHDQLERARRRLRQASQLASLGQLAAGIAHEIRNPLNFVTNFAEASQESVDELRDLLAPHRPTLPGETLATLDELLDTLGEDMATIVRHGQRAARIVEQMLAHARGDEGPPRQVALNPLVEESLQLAYHGARAADPAFRVQIQCHCDPAVEQIQAVAANLSRALINLINNGFEAAIQRARHEDESFQPQLTVRTASEAQGLVVSIRDNGSGIPEAVRARLGEPFYTTKPPGTGTGLGFALSREIIQRHRGSLTVDSRPGEHTEIRIHLPHPPDEV